MSFTTARAEVAALEVNPLWGHEKQTAEVRKDALAILTRLEAATEPPSYCPSCGTPTTPHCEREAMEGE